MGKIKMNWNEKEHTLSIEKLLFGAKNALLEEATKTEVVGGVVKATISQAKYKELLILKCLKQAPFPINLREIQGLSAEQGEFLYKECEELNTVSKKE